MPPIAFTQQATLVPPNLDGSGDIRDLAISGDGNTVAIGYAPGGQVFVYRRAGGDWSLEATLDSPVGIDEGPGALDALALSGDGSRLAWGESQSAAVSIFARDGGDTWGEEITLVGVSDSDGFGSSVSIDAAGVSVLIGEPGVAADGVDGVGEAHLATYDGTWAVTTSFTGQGGPFVTGHRGGGYGVPVCLSEDGESGVIVAPGNTVDAGGGMTEPWVGSFFTLDGQEVDADAFGSAFVAATMSPDGNTFLVSASDDDPSYFVQSFRRSGGVWDVAEKLEPVGYNELASIIVPMSLSRDGNLAAISDGNGFWIMAYDSDVGWVQQGDAYEPPEDVDGYAFFGASLALSADGRTLAVRTLQNPTVIYTRGGGFAVSFDGIEYG